MRALHLLALLIGFGLAAPSRAFAAALTVPSASAPVEVVREVWWDAARDRAVPVKAYLPAGPGPFSTIVFSHGLGATREAYSYLTEHWARAGFATVCLQHAGTDGGIFRPGRSRTEAMSAAIADWELAMARPLDVRFAIDRLVAQNRAGRGFAARLDLERLGVAGHSFGAWTALVIAGLRISPERSGGPLAPSAAFADPRVKAVVALSAPVQRDRPGAPTHDDVYGDIRRPVLLMTGTRDLSPVGDLKASERRIPFDHLRREAMLVTFTDGDHWIFSGRGFRVAPKPMDPEFQERIRLSSTAFWRAYLCGDAAARRWLRGDGFRAALGALGQFEVR